MDPALELLAFAGVMALGQFSPGPDMVLLTRTALAEGVAGGVRMALGIATGLTVHATLALGGTSVVFQREGWPRTGMKWIAAAYLLWLASGLGRSWFARVFSHESSEEAPRRGHRSAYVRGLFCNLLNPKALLFLAAVVAPFLSGDRPGWWPAALWAVVVFQAMALWSLWAAVLQWRPVRAGYRNAGPWLDLGFGLALAVLGVGLVVW